MLRTTLRRTPAALLLAMLLGVAGAGIAAAAPMDNGSNTPKPPGGTTVLGEHHSRVCVQGFKPGSQVHVVNQTTGQTGTINTNFKGKGCTTLPVSHACHSATQTIVETGTAPDGKATTVTQTVNVPADSSLCVSSAGSTLPFTGSNIIMPTIAGVLLIALGTALLAVRRRGRAAGVTG